MLKLFSNHTSMCIFRSHNFNRFFFLNRWNHEEIWNCSNILLNLYDIYRNNCLYYQVISNVFRSKCYHLWIEKKYKGSMLGPYFFLSTLIILFKIFNQIHVFLQMMLLYLLYILLTIPSLLVIDQTWRRQN